MDSGGIDTTIRENPTEYKKSLLGEFTSCEPATNEAPVDDTVLGGTPWCIRCGTKLEWRHSSWQCPKCHYKEGCCG